MKDEIASYIRENGGTPWLALRSLMRSVVASDFIRKIAETFATRIALIAIGLVTSVIVARILGPEGRGLYAVAVTVGAIGVQFGNLGLHASNTYYVAKDRALLPSLVGNTLFVSFVIGGLGAGVTWVLFSLWPNLAPVHGRLLMLSLIWIPMGLVYMLFQNLLLGIQEVRAYNKIELIMQIVGVALIVIVLVFKAVTVEAVYSMGLITLTLSGIWAFRRIKPHLIQRPALSPSLFKKNLQYGTKAYLAAFFAFLVLRIDMLMVKHMLGADQAGYYSIAVTMADMVYMLPVVIGTVLFPKLSSLPNNKEKWDFSKRTAVAVCIVMIITAGLVAVLSRPMVRLLFGALFIPAVPAFIWLMPGIVMLSINTVYMNYFASTGMPLIAVYSPGAAATLNIVLNIKLIPLWGIVGASISSVIAYGVMLAFSLLFISRMGEQRYE